MSVFARRRAALLVAIAALSGCGVRVSLGESGGAFASADGGSFEVDADEPIDAETLDALDALADSEPPDVSDGAVDDAPLAD